MNEKKIVWGQNPDDEFAKKLEEATGRVKERMAEKDSKAAQCPISEQELLSILTRADKFKGKVADMDKLARFEDMKKLTVWLDANCYQVAKVMVEDPSPTHPNVIISVDFHRLGSIRGKDLEVFGALCKLADDMFIGGHMEKTVRFTFGLLGVWQE